MPAYAHTVTRPDGSPAPKSEWEPLETHIQEVAKAAEEFAAAFAEIKMPYLPSAFFNGCIDFLRRQKSLHPPANHLILPNNLLNLRPPHSLKRLSQQLYRHFLGRTPNRRRPSLQRHNQTVRDVSNSQCFHGIALDERHSTTCPRRGRSSVTTLCLLLFQPAPHQRRKASPHTAFAFDCWIRTSHSQIPLKPAGGVRDGASTVSAENMLSRNSLFAYS